MAKAKKEGQFFNCFMKKELIDQIDECADKTGLSKTAIVEKALEQYFDISKSKQRLDTTEGKLDEED